MVFMYMAYIVNRVSCLGHTPSKVMMVFTYVIYNLAFDLGHAESALMMVFMWPI